MLTGNQQINDVTKLDDILCISLNKCLPLCFRCSLQSTGNAQIIDVSDVNKSRILVDSFS